MANYLTYAGSPDIFTKEGKRITEQEAQTAGLFTPQGLSPQVEKILTPRPDITQENQFAQKAGLDIPTVPFSLPPITPEATSATLTQPKFDYTPLLAEQKQYREQKGNQQLADLSQKQTIRGLIFQGITDPEEIAKSMTEAGKASGITEPFTSGQVISLMGPELDYYKSIQSEKDINKQIADIRAQASEAQIGAEERGMARGAEGRYVRGEQLIQEKRFAAQEANLLSRLGLEQESRKALIEGMGFISKDIETQQKIQERLDAEEDKILTRAQTLSTTQKNNLALIADAFKDDDFDTMTTETKNEIAKLAMQYGLDIDLAFRTSRNVADEYQFKQMKEAAALQPKETSEIQEYRLAQEQGFKGSFLDYKKALKAEETGIGGVAGTGSIDRDVESIMGGSGLNLNDLPTKGNYRASVASKLAVKKKEAISKNDFVGVLRASAGGKEVGDAFITSFEKGLNVVGQMSDLQTIISGEETGPIVNIWRSRNPYDEKAQQIKAQLSAIVPNLARGIYGEVGVLTDNDIALYSRTLPNLGSVEELRNAILGLTLRSVQRSLENKLKTQANAGRDVSGFENTYLAVKNQSDTLLNQVGMGKGNVLDSIIGGKTSGDTISGGEEKGIIGGTIDWMGSLFNKIIGK